MAKKIIKSRDLEKHSTLQDRVKSGAEAVRPIQVVSCGGRVVNKKVIDAGERADAMVTGAQAEVAKMKAEAERLLAEVEQVRAEAKAEGLREGREEGLASVTALAAQLAIAKEQFFANVEGDIIRLILASTEKIIGQLAEQHRDVICEVARLAIKASIGDHIVVRVHPEDYKTVIAVEDSFRDLLDRTKRLHFKEDETISRGGCVVETEVGTIDAQLEIQLKAIRKALEL